MKELSLKRSIKIINVAKALNMKNINCPVRQLADGAIEKQTVTGL
jgi:hypothetical protein